MNKDLLPGVWRDLKCLECGNPTGFTAANLDEVMCKDYVKRFHCQTCDKCTNQDWLGTPYGYMGSEKVYLELDFNETI